MKYFGSSNDTADADVKRKYSSSSADTAGSGKFNLANDEEICWRDSGNTADVCFKYGTSDSFDFVENFVDDIDYTVSGYVMSLRIRRYLATDANVGEIRLANGDIIAWATADGLSNVTFYLDGSDEFQLDSDMRVAGGIGGTPEVRAVGMLTASGSASITFGSTNDFKRMIIPSNTTTAVNALTDQRARIVYDTTINKLKVNTGSGWETVTSS